MADFGNIQTPDFAKAALGGYSAGRAVGVAKQRDAALQAYQTDPEGGIEALTAVDPALAEQLRENQERKLKRAAYADLYKPRAPAPALGGAPGVVGALGAPVASPPGVEMPQAMPPVPPATPMAGGIGLQVNPEALQRLAAIDAEGARKVMEFAASADKQRIDAFKAHAEVKGQLALYLKSLPPAQRPAAFQAAMPVLLARGFVPQASEGMNFDDAALDRDVALAVPTVQALTQRRADEEAAARAADRAADNRRADAGLGLRERALVAAEKRASKPADTSNLGALDDAALMAIAMGQN